MGRARIDAEASSCPDCGASVYKCRPARQAPTVAQALFCGPLEILLDAEKQPAVIPGGRDHRDLSRVAEVYMLHRCPAREEDPQRDR